MRKITHKLAEVSPEVDLGKRSLSDLRPDVNVVHVQVEVAVVEAEGVVLRAHAVYIPGASKHRSVRNGAHRFFCVLKNRTESWSVSFSYRLLFRGQLSVHRLMASEFFESPQTLRRLSLLAAVRYNNSSFLRRYL